jgi:secernin
MCDTMVVVESERVLFAKNSDRDPNEGQVLERHDARRNAPGTKLRCTWIEIDDVSETLPVLLSRPFWMWGAEIGANAAGVVIGNEAVFTDQTYAKSGLTGMDLLRLALERGETAQAAVNVILTLLERHGQGGGCGHEDRTFTYHNSFIVADRTGAFVVETAGKLHATERVVGARSISNGLTIPAFRAAHADRLRNSVSACDVRTARTVDGISRGEGVRGMMAALRDHGDAAWPTYALVNGTLRMPCMHGGGVVAGSQTTASWVAELSSSGDKHYVTATAAPCLSLFKPVAVEAPVDLGPPPGEHDDGMSLFWLHERLHRAVMRDPARLAPLFLDERDALETRVLDGVLSSVDAFARHREALPMWTTRVREATKNDDTRPWHARRYWQRRERSALGA